MSKNPQRSPQTDEHKKRGTTFEGQFTTQGDTSSVMSWNSFRFQKALSMCLESSTTCSMMGRALLLCALLALALHRAGDSLLCHRYSITGSCTCGMYHWRRMPLCVAAVLAAFDQLFAGARGGWRSTRRRGVAQGATQFKGVGSHLRQH
jgi:hypothetical protein